MNAQDIKDILAELAAVDFNTVPSLRFAAALRDKLKAGPAAQMGWTNADIDHIVLSMNIELGMVELTDADIDEMAQSFALVVFKTASALYAKGFSDTAMAMRLAAPRLSLKLTA